MALLSGLSKYVMTQMARGAASVATQINLLGSPDPDMARRAEGNMKAEGTPTTMRDLIATAASVISRQKMDRLKKNQYLGAIQGYLVIMGMSHANATYIKELIELSAS